MEESEGKNVDRKARIFISCGQNKKSNEPKMAKQISQHLEEMGFEPYAAVYEQSVEGLLDNIIFNHLEESEYFLFIDFKREKLLKDTENDSDVFRGSLFTNQELAISSFLKIPVIAFQEVGVKPQDGMAGAMQLNPIPFNDRTELINLIAKEVIKRKWNSNHRNELVVKRDSFEHTNFPVGNDMVMHRFFHLSVNNLHSWKTAQNCYFYLERVLNNDSRTEIRLKTIELKWRGYELPNAHILPRSSREADAFYVNPNNPSILMFLTNVSDSPEFRQTISEPGQYKLTYSVFSDNFPKASISLLLKLPGSLDGIKLEEIETDLTTTT